MSQQTLNDLRVPVPPSAEQAAIIEAVVESIDSMKATGEGVGTMGDELGRLNQSILAKAFRGELVPQDPEDEPASVLLERIRAEREAAAEAAGGTRKRRGRRTEKAGAIR